MPPSFMDCGICLASFNLYTVRREHPSILHRSFTVSSSTLCSILNNTSLLYHIVLCFYKYRTTFVLGGATRGLAKPEYKGFQPVCRRFVLHHRHYYSSGLLLVVFRISKKHLFRQILHNVAELPHLQQVGDNDV